MRAKGIDPVFLIPEVLRIGTYADYGQGRVRPVMYVFGPDLFSRQETGFQRPRADEERTGNIKGFSINRR